MRILKSHLVVAESDGEPPIVAIHNLNAVLSRAAGQSLNLSHRNGFHKEKDQNMAGGTELIAQPDDLCYVLVGT